MPKVKAAPQKKPAKAKKAQSLADAVERHTLAGIAGALVIGLAVVAIMWAGGYVGLLAERIDRSARQTAVRAGFDVTTVTLMGRSQASREEIMSAIGPAVGESILHFNLEETRRRVENLGWVKSASVSRLLPHTIHVSVRERAPAAVWQMSGHMHLIDAGGAVIRSLRGDEYADLPLVVGAGAPEAAADILTAIAARPALKDEVKSLNRMGDRRWDLRLASGVAVLLPEGDFGEALDILARLQEREPALDRSIEQIDLRDPERVTARRRGLDVPLAE